MSGRLYPTITWQRFGERPHPPTRLQWDLNLMHVPLGGPSEARAELDWTSERPVVRFQA